MSASDSSIPGGQPSTTQPIAGPWDSPKFVTRKSVPRVLPDIRLVRLLRGGQLVAALDRPIADVGLEHAVLEILAVDHGAGDVVERDHAHQGTVAHHRRVAGVAAEHDAAHL